VYLCPACKTDDVSGKDRCRCGADLSLLQRLSALVDAWFNRALELHAQGQSSRALELLAACCVVSPNDAEARIVQAQILAGLGRRQEAREVLQIARDIDPGQADLASLKAALVEVTTTVQATAPAVAKSDRPKKARRSLQKRRGTPRRDMKHGEKRR
jgi:tetratricopeptide (TPR) repeat protein